MHESRSISHGCGAARSPQVVKEVRLHANAHHGCGTALLPGTGGGQGIGARGERPMHPRRGMRCRPCDHLPCGYLDSQTQGQVVRLVFYSPAPGIYLYHAMVTFIRAWCVCESHVYGIGFKGSTTECCASLSHRQASFLVRKPLSRIGARKAMMVTLKSRPGEIP